MGKSDARADAPSSPTTAMLAKNSFCTDAPKLKFEPTPKSYCNSHFCPTDLIDLPQFMRAIFEEVAIRQQPSCAS